MSLLTDIQHHIAVVSHRPSPAISLPLYQDTTPRFSFEPIYSGFDSTLFRNYSFPIRKSNIFSGNLASFKQTLTHKSACFSECTQRGQTGPTGIPYSRYMLSQCHPLNKAKPTSVYKTNPEVSTNWDECQLYQQGSSVS